MNENTESMAHQILNYRLSEPEEASENQPIKQTIRGRPKFHDKKWTKVTTVLFKSQIAWLDHLAADIRMNTGAALNRAELIRGILSAVEKSGLDFSTIESEEELSEIILNRILSK